MNKYRMSQNQFNVINQTMDTAVNDTKYVELGAKKNLRKIRGILGAVRPAVTFGAGTDFNGTVADAKIENLYVMSVKRYNLMRVLLDLAVETSTNKEFSDKYLLPLINTFRSVELISVREMPYPVSVRMR